MNLIRVDQVVKATSLSRATIYNKMRVQEFPSAVKLGKRAVAWKVADIAAWIDSRPVSYSGVGK